MQRRALVNGFVVLVVPALSVLIGKRVHRCFFDAVAVQTYFSERFTASLVGAAFCSAAAKRESAIRLLTERHLHADVVLLSFPGRACFASEM